MTTSMTITVNGPKAGELIYFKLTVLKTSYLNVVDMEFNSVEDVLKGEANGHYTIQK